MEHVTDLILAACGGGGVSQTSTTITVATTANRAVASTTSGASAPSAPLASTLATGAQATMTMLGWDAQPIQGVRRSSMAPFSQLHSGVALEMVSVPGGYSGGYGDKLQAMIASGGPPDHFIIPDSALPYYLINSLAHNLSPYVNRDHYDLTQFPKVAIDQYGYKGGLYGLPDNVSSIGMFVNSDQFQRAGITPHPPTCNRPAGTSLPFLLPPRR